MRMAGDACHTSTPYSVREAVGSRLTWLCAGVEVALFAAVIGQVVIAVLLAGRVALPQLGGLIILTSAPAVTVVLRMPKIIREIAGLERVLEIRPETPTRNPRKCAPSVRRPSAHRVARTTVLAPGSRREKSVALAVPR